MVEPPQRRFVGSSDRPPGRDVDAAEEAVRLRVGGWAIVIGVVGVPISLLLGVKVGAEPPWSWLFLLGGPVAGYVVYRLSMAVVTGGGAVMGQIHNPSGKTTPAVREYSKPQALAVRGNFREAIEAYRDAVDRYPEDPEPYVRIARLYRDKLYEYDQALSWFKRARAESAIDPGRELLVTQEIIEIYRNRLDQPARAIPELARLLERFPDHPSHAAMQRELADLRIEHLKDGA